jgi:hypothetical protein
MKMIIVGCNTRGTLMMGGYDSIRKGDKGGNYSWVLIQTHILEFYYHC